MLSALIALAAHAEALAPHARVVLPEGPGPFPVALQFHGCGGRKALQDQWAAALAARGVAAVVVDSYAPRGIGRFEAYATVCTGLRLHGDARAADVYAMTAWAKAQPWADPARIGLIGWSHGGWTVLEALTLRPGEEMADATGLANLPDQPLAGVHAAVALYPYCGIACRAGRRPFEARIPLLAMLGGADTVVGWRVPMAALERQRAWGAEVHIEIFKGATHAFDEAEASDLRVRYDAQATARAQSLAADFLLR